MYRAGRLRHYCDFIEDTSADGSETPTFDTNNPTLANWPCNVYDVAGQETFRGRQLEATTTHVVDTRYSATITATMQIVDHLSRTLEIISITDRSGRQRYLELHCAEVIS